MCKPAVMLYSKGSQRVGRRSVQISSWAEGEKKTMLNANNKIYYINNIIQSEMEKI